MIRLTRLSGSPFVLNSDLIERIDETPDTIITLGDGTIYVAAESVDDVVTAIRMHRAEIIALSEVVRISQRESDHAPAGRPELATVTDLPTAAGLAVAHDLGEDA
jgi:flagellar protein FlbD